MNVMGDKMRLQTKVDLVSKRETENSIVNSKQQVLLGCWLLLVQWLRCVFFFYFGYGFS